MSSPHSARSNSNQRASTSSSGTRPWWRWRGNRTPASLPPDEAEQPNWGLRLERLCAQLSPLLPPLSSNARKAIVLIILLVLMWKLLLWTLEIIITSLGFIAAVSILLAFIRPDIAFVIVTQELPPKVEQARLWLSKVLLDAGECLTGRTQSTSTDALQFTSTVLPTAANPHRSRSIHSQPRALSEGSLIRTSA